MTGKGHFPKLSAPINNNLHQIKFSAVYNIVPFKNYCLSIYDPSNTYIFPCNMCIYIHIYSSCVILYFFFFGPEKMKRTDTRPLWDFLYLKL